MKDLHLETGLAPLLRPHLLGKVLQNRPSPSRVVLPLGKQRDSALSSNILKLILRKPPVMGPSKHLTPVRKLRQKEQATLAPSRRLTNRKSLVVHGIPLFSLLLTTSR